MFLAILYFFFPSENKNLCVNLGTCANLIHTAYGIVWVDVLNFKMVVEKTSQSKRVVLCEEGLHVRGAKLPRQNPKECTVPEML